MKLIGVTGTDGKTTTVEMIAHILEQAGVPYLSSSSLESKINGKKIANSKRTTPSLSSLKKLLETATREQVKVAVIEVSSHALVQWRIFSVQFDTAVLTNITHEHLNFHKTRKRYAAAKKLLFTKHLKYGGEAILNEEDEYGRKWMTELRGSAIGYRQPEASSNSSGTFFTYLGKEYSMPMLGRYNASNALSAALAVSSVLPDISTDKALSYVSNFTGIPGRMQLIKSSNDQPTIIVDFALTGRAMASALNTARELAGSNNKVFIVFGATGGQHDITVRPGVAKSVSSFADVAIVTDDESYDSDPTDIRKDLASLIDRANKESNNHTIIKNIGDRKLAIRKALYDAHSNDVIIVSGMGHYTSKTVNGIEIPWNDAHIVTEELTKL